KKNGGVNGSQQSAPITSASQSIVGGGNVIDGKPAVFAPSNNQQSFVPAFAQQERTGLQQPVNGFVPRTDGGYKGFFGSDVSLSAKEFNTQFENITGYRDFDLSTPTPAKEGSL